MGVNAFKMMSRDKRKKKKKRKPWLSMIFHSNPRWLCLLLESWNVLCLWKSWVSFLSIALMNTCSRAWGESVKGERLSEQKVTAANLTYCHLPTLFPRTQSPEQDSQSDEQCFQKLQDLDLGLNKSSVLWLLTCS